MFLKFKPLSSTAANTISLSFLKSLLIYSNAILVSFIAASTISLSFCNSSLAYRKIRPFLLTASNIISLSLLKSKCNTFSMLLHKYLFICFIEVNTISLSFLNSNPINSYAKPFCLTASNIISLSFFNLSLAYCKDNPFSFTASNTTFSSSCNSRPAYSNSNAQLLSFSIFSHIFLIILLTVIISKYSLMGISSITGSFTNFST